MLVTSNNSFQREKQTLLSALDMKLCLSVAQYEKCNEKGETVRLLYHFRLCNVKWKFLITVFAKEVAAGRVRLAGRRKFDTSGKSRRNRTAIIKVSHFSFFKINLATYFII